MNDKQFIVNCIKDYIKEYLDNNKHIEEYTENLYNNFINNYSKLIKITFPNIDGEFDWRQFSREYIRASKFKMAVTKHGTKETFRGGV